MAATYGRLTGKAGVCLSTLGPGATVFSSSARLGYTTGEKPWPATLIAVAFASPLPIRVTRAPSYANTPACPALCTCLSRT